MFGFNFIIISVSYNILSREIIILAMGKLKWHFKAGYLSEI